MRKWKKIDRCYIETTGTVILPNKIKIIAGNNEVMEALNHSVRVLKALPTADEFRHYGTRFCRVRRDLQNCALIAPNLRLVINLLRAYRSARRLRIYTVHEFNSLSPFSLCISLNIKTSYSFLHNFLSCGYIDSISFYEYYLILHHYLVQFTPIFFFMDIKIRVTFFIHENTSHIIIIRTCWLKKDWFTPLP